ncbi:elongation factor P 5-aminopentanone reductase [Lactobacillus apis]|uniref:elongation factor P 5-aminopentanone reductase n=1 Tax=Lactobacillus apis TaxID=303541 RepID=UPI00242DAC7A|nr:SDR family NAD(P)-dependent oxidoreductase [Lactobacillus apis]
MQRAIVFGATGGIGRLICTDLAEAGWSLYIHCSNNWPAACEMSESFMKQYPSQEFLPLKFSFFAENNELEKMVQSLLPINAVIFAQGITDYHLLSDQNLDKVDEVMQVNLVTPIKLTSLLEPLLLKNDFSRIIFIGSVYGAQGSAMEAVYSATKAGLSRFSQAYAREVASANLTVNVIAPGAVDTAMNKMISVEEMAEVVGEIPAGRLASGADISFWVKALLDPNSTYLTGQTLYVSGGWLT